MRRRLRDQTEEVKAAHNVTGEACDDSWVYCDACHRAMAQGDCVFDDLGPGLRCAYDDCSLESSLSYRSLYGWDAYRQAHELQTAGWPAEPEPGVCYDLSTVI